MEKNIQGGSLKRCKKGSGEKGYQKTREAIIKDILAKFKINKGS